MKSERDSGYKLESEGCPITDYLMILWSRTGNPPPRV